MPLRLGMDSFSAEVLVQIFANLETADLVPPALALARRICSHLASAAIGGGGGVPFAAARWRWGKLAASGTVC